MTRRLFISSLLFSFFTMAVCSMPARRDARLVTQPDGSVITVYAHGDEHFHWLTDSDGRWLEEGSDGYFREVPALTQEQIASRRKASPYRSPEAVATAIPLNLAPRGLVILAEFPDVKFTTPRDTVDTMLIGYNFTRDYAFTYNNREYNVHSSGSARQYFLACSNGQYEPQFDIIGPVTVSQNMEYYGSNEGGRDKNVIELIKEACVLANAKGVDFSLYDNDNDGNVDFVYVIYAGFGEADGGPANTIWPHKHEISKSKTITLNGKAIYMYACGNEMNFYSKLYFGIGQFVHEFGHVLGLPDIYSTSSGNYKTLGEWDIMDYGPYSNDGNTPPAYSAYERFFCGWTTPRVLTDPENVVLNELGSSNEVLLLTEDGTHNLIGNNPFPLTFYTLENRQQTGWYTYCPGHGLLITRISYDYNRWRGNVVNTSSTNLGIDIMEADGLAPSYPDYDWYGKATDAFPAGATEFRQVTGSPLTDIKETNGIISFRFKGGTVTDINDVQQPEVTEKKIENGQVFIYRNGYKYNLLGTIITQ
ncbi:MAG: M6 family metalloprotease domain-containing protein [Paludibacteraceae bacterium]|nr:M6 family metalloprotease domain-containing protein [Paludibacteraceae bacterium]